MDEQTIWIGTDQYFLLPRGTIMPNGGDTLRNLQGDRIFSDVERLEKYEISVEDALKFILDTQFPLKESEPEQAGMAAQVGNASQQNSAQTNKKRPRLRVTVLEDPIELKHETLSVKLDTAKSADEAKFTRFLSDMEAMIRQYRQEL